MALPERARSSMLLQRVAQALLPGLPAALLEVDSALLELRLLLEADSALLELRLLLEADSALLELRLLLRALLLQDRLSSKLCLGLGPVLLAALALALPVSANREGTRLWMMVLFSAVNLEGKLAGWLYWKSIIPTTMLSGPWASSELWVVELLRLIFRVLDSSWDTA